jgi:hypothetical protein
MTEPKEDMLYEGVNVEFRFPEKQPTFGDLLSMIGESSPQFPRSGHADWGQLVGLGFEQADDYFALPGETDDYSIWLYPVVGNRVVEHHSGPFDGIRLQYCVLRNPADTAEQFRHAVTEFAEITMRPANYCGRDLGLPPVLTQLEKDIDAIVAHWRSENIEPGSDEALLVEF